jgi:hypothetical protein
MKSGWFVGFVVLVSALSSACVPLSQPKPISGESAEIQNYLGLFTIIPPQGDNWYETIRKDGVLAYGKKLQSRDDTFIASVHVSSTDKKFTNENDFLAFAKMSRASDTSPDRFKLLVNDESVDRTRSAYCTTFHLRAEDHAASKSAGALKILETKGFTCLHPEEPLIVTVQYSERSGSPFGNATLLSEGEGFINSLELQ